MHAFNKVRMKLPFIKAEIKNEGGKYHKYANLSKS